MKLQCEPAWKTYALQSSFMFSYFIGYAFVYMPEKYGRRPTLIVFTFLTLVGIAMCIYVNIFWVKLAGMILMGVTHVKKTVSMIMVYEFLPKSIRNFGSTVCSIVDSSTMLITIIYYKSGGVSVVTIQSWAFGVSVLVWILIIVYIPESPTWLIYNNKHLRA